MSGHALLAHAWKRGARNLRMCDISTCIEQRTNTTVQQFVADYIGEMGGKSSRQSSQLQVLAKENGDGQNTLRAISKGRVYVIISFPAAVEQMENCHFTEAGYDELLGDLQEVIYTTIPVMIVVLLYPTLNY